MSAVLQTQQCPYCDQWVEAPTSVGPHFYHSRCGLMEGDNAVLIRDSKNGLWVCISHPNDPPDIDSRAACRMRWWFSVEEASEHAGRMAG